MSKCVFVNRSATICFNKQSYEHLSGTFVSNFSAKTHSMEEMEVMSVVGVIGAGLMGTACTQRLVGSGFTVLAFDIDLNKLDAIEGIGAIKAESILEIVRRANAIIIAVLNTDQVEQVVEGVAALLNENSRSDSPILICTSTCDPDRLAALVVR